MVSPGCKIPVGLALALDEAGVSPADVLSAARLPARLLDVPGQRLPIPEYFALWQAIADVSADSSIGIRLATSVKADLTEPLFLAILSAADVAGALDVLARYKRLLNPEQLDLHADEGGGARTVTYRWPAGTPSLPRALVDAELTFVVEMCRRATRVPGLSPRAVHLPAAILPAGTEHAAFFRCPIHLGVAAYGLTFDAVDCARPFLTHNPQLSAALLPYLQASVPAPPRGTIARVRTAISERLRGRRPTVRAVAKDLAMSDRSLQRALQENGTSFRELLDDVRNDQARGYLTTTVFTDVEIAFLLGFEDPTSFYRAFRGWNHMSPAEYRRSLAAHRGPHSRAAPSR